MNNIYNPTNAKSINYLYKIYIKDFYLCFVKFYINKVLYFNTTITFYAKDVYAIFKEQLNTGIENFKVVVYSINLFSIIEIYNHFLVISTA